VGSRGPAPGDGWFGRGTTARGIPGQAHRSWLRAARRCPAPRSHCIRLPVPARRAGQRLCGPRRLGRAVLFVAGSSARARGRGRVRQGTGPRDHRAREVARSMGCRAGGGSGSPGHRGRGSRSGPDARRKRLAGRRRERGPGFGQGTSLGETGWDLLRGPPFRRPRRAASRAEHLVRREFAGRGGLLRAAPRRRQVGGRDLGERGLGIGRGDQGRTGDTGRAGGVRPGEDRTHEQTAPAPRRRQVRGTGAQCLRRDRAPGRRRRSQLCQSISRAGARPQTG